MNHFQADQEIWLSLSGELALLQERLSTDERRKIVCVLGRSRIELSFR